MPEITAKAHIKVHDFHDKLSHVMNQYGNDGHEG
jgi:hypothetical protein